MALGVLSLGNDRPPWLARRRPLPLTNRAAEARVDIEDWPAEPASPARVDPARFTQALRTLCGGLSPDRASRYGGWILEHAAEFEVDPFLLGALVYREGRCRPDAQSGDRTSGHGLTLIHREMYTENLRGGVLRYAVRANDRWQTQERRVDRFPFAGPRLLQAETNIYFAAALLRMWRDQHETVDRSFEQHAHRHFVSHWVYGDRVRSDRPEDEILTDRRRLLEHYGAHRGAPTLTWNGVTFGCPLYGCPRVISSWLGNERESGARSHRGVDVESLPDEPVRAVADGTVVFAGVDLPGALAHVQLASPAEYERYPRGQLGAGGRYVCIRHRASSGPSVRSCSMHLEEVRVRYGQEVRRGDVIGTVGRTGMQDSAAHLHLELHTDARLEDPSVVLQGLLLGRRPSSR
jgi:murein DD-endopeptidase MepM/ murein hydrolase activator NlpD